MGPPERRVTGRCRHGTVDAYILAEETMNDLPLRPAADIGAVEDRFFTLRNSRLTDAPRPGTHRPST
jgi:hypothetical protein